MTGPQQEAISPEMSKVDVNTQSKMSTVRSHRHPNYTPEMRRHKYSSETVHYKRMLLNFKEHALTHTHKRHKEKVFFSVFLTITWQLFSNEVFARSSDWEHI